jgi:hypothetical protein
MRRRLWLFLTLSLVLVAIALISVRYFDGSGGIASAHVNTGAVHIEIDVVEDAGGTWCNPVDSSTTVAVGTPHKAAICLSDAASIAPGAFNIELDYNGDLNLCTDSAQVTGGMDMNPDANVGATVFSGSAGAGALGTGCDCSSGGLGFPTCNYDTGGVVELPEKAAFVSCVCALSQTLPVGTGVSSPLAVVTFTATGGGDDVLSFGTVSVTRTGAPTLRCPGAQCFSATVHKSGPTPLPATVTPLPPTPTSTPSCGLEGQVRCPTSTATSRPFTRTPSPAPTNTPGAGEPTVPPPPPPPPPPPSGGQQPSVTPPNTGTGPGGVTWATTLMWILGSGTALSLLAGGFYLRRVNNR